MHFFLLLTLLFVCQFLELDSIDEHIVLLALDFLVLVGKPVVAFGVGAIDFLGGLCGLDALFGLTELGVAEAQVEPGIFIIGMLLLQVLLVVPDGLLVLPVLEALVAPLLGAHGFDIILIVRHISQLG